MEKVNLNPPPVKSQGPRYLLSTASLLPPFLPKQEGQEEDMTVPTFSLPRKLAAGVRLSPFGYFLNQTAPESPFFPWNQQLCHIWVYNALLGFRFQTR